MLTSTWTAEEIAMLLIGASFGCLNLAPLGGSFLREQASNIDDALDKLTNTIRHIAAFSSVLKHSEVFKRSWRIQRCRQGYPS